MEGTSILWRRLDTPGHDACRLEERAQGWSLEGVAVFRHEGLPAQLAYAVACDREWRAQQGHVKGWLGGQSVDFSISRTPQGGWTLNGAEMSGLGGCLDLDFGFTPATNFFQLRRLNLATGKAGDAPAAWLDVSAGTLDLLAQRYERRSERSYWYEAPRFGYAAMLDVTAAGFIGNYPGLWAEEA